MLSGDYLMRQVHQLAQVLARVLVRRQTEDTHIVLEEIQSAWRAEPALGDHHPAELSREEVVAACTVNGRFNTEKALLIANLLDEESQILTEVGQIGRSAQCALRGLWLYEASTRDPEAALPIDFAARMDRLRAKTDR